MDGGGKYKGLSFQKQKRAFPAVVFFLPIPLFFGHSPTVPVTSPAGFRDDGRSIFKELTK